MTASLIFCSLLLLLNSFIWGQEKKEQSADVQIIKELGQPLHVVWSDGREAQLEITETLNQRVAMEFENFENTCGDTISKPCQYHVGLSMTLFRWVWIKYQQNPERIGKTLEIQFEEKGDFNPYSLLVQKGILNRMNNEFLSQNVPSDQLICENSDWLEPFLASRDLTGAPKAVFVKIGTWSTELMLQNPETDENENRTIFNLFDVHLAYDPMSKSLTLDRIGDSIGVFPVNSFIIVGDVIQWNLENTSSQQCSLAFKPNVDKLFRKFENIATDLKSLKSVAMVYEGEEKLKLINELGRSMVDFLNSANKPYEVR